MQHVHSQAQPASLAKSYDLVVSLGTDYHHFDRLIDWVEAFLQDNPQVSCLVQHGFTRPALGADTVERMPRTELLSYYETAKVVLVQGGPGSILDAREMGIIPFAVPRLKNFDEVVDNHQVQFSKVMEARGETIIIENAQDLAIKISQALEDPATVRATKRIAESDIAAENLEEAIIQMYQIPVTNRGRFSRRCVQVARSFFIRTQFS